MLTFRDSTLSRTLPGLNPAHSHIRPVDGSWTIQENLCHLADTEGLFAERMRRVLSEDRPPLPVADQDACMETLACSQRVIEEEIAVIQAIRRQMSRILRAQPAEAWSRVGIHSQAGEQTLEQIVQKAVNHLDHHLKFVRAKREALEERAS
ncbi:MAG: DinB family protein [Planctomycetales bacterium]